MKEQLVTYEIALKLKEAGFSEPCFSRFIRENINVKNDDGSYVYPMELEPFVINLDEESGLLVQVRNWNLSLNKFKNTTMISAPLWQQVIDWLRKDQEMLILEAFDARWFVYGKVEERHAPKGWAIRKLSNHPSREAAILKAIELIKKQP